nr:hypothetical protein [Halomarina sp. BCD28]
MDGVVPHLRWGEAERFDAHRAEFHPEAEPPVVAQDGVDGVVVDEVACVVQDERPPVHLDALEDVRAVAVDEVDPLVGQPPVAGRDVDVGRPRTVRAGRELEGVVGERDDCDPNVPDRERRRSPRA